MDDDFVKKRLERDLAELKRLCEDHFKEMFTSGLPISGSEMIYWITLKQREIDEAEVKALEERIEKYHKVYISYWDAEY